MSWILNLRILLSIGRAFIYIYILQYIYVRLVMPTYLFVCIYFNAWYQVHHMLSKMRWSSRNLHMVIGEVLVLGLLVVVCKLPHSSCMWVRQDVVGVLPSHYCLSGVIRLSLGRRLVNLLPVAQRTNAFTNGVVGRTMGRWSWVRISRPPWKRFLKKSEFPHVKNLANHSPWVPRDCKELRSRHIRPHTKTKNLSVQRESVIRLSLGRRLVNLLPVAQRTSAFTLVRSWVRISRPPRKRFLKKSEFPHVKNLIESLSMGPQRL